MKTKTQLLITSLMVASFFVQDAEAQSVLAEGAKLELLSRGFSFTEGPTCDSKGNVYFTDQNLDRILKWSTDGILTVFMSPSGRANGMFMDAQDHLIACADEKNELWRISLDGKKEVLMKGGDANEKLFNGPNDVWVHPNGDYYFTDPLYKRPWWGDRTGKEMDGQHVYRMGAGKDKFPTRLTDDLKQPNGIIGTPDGKTLFVADIGAGIIYRYDILSDGELGNRQLFCKGQSDGMTLDDAGNLYITNSRGVVVYNKAGEEREVIKVPEGWTANASFGGKNHDVLFITASKGLYSIQMKHKGANAAK
jgi:gluconolactonase